MSMKDCQMISTGGGLSRLGNGGVLLFCSHVHCACYKLDLMVSDLAYMYHKIMIDWLID